MEKKVYIKTYWNRIFKTWNNEVCIEKCYILYFDSNWELI